MLLFMFAGFFAGFCLSFLFVKRPRRALIWGLVLGGVPLALILGPGTAPVEGIGSILNFAFFALGPLMLIPFIAISFALGVAGCAGVLWFGQGRARWVRWVAGVSLVAIVAVLTVWPVVQRESASQEATENRNARAEAIIRADFEGTMGGHPVAFPASPRLTVFDECGPDGSDQIFLLGIVGCMTSLQDPVSILTDSNEELLHERKGPLVVREIRVERVLSGCDPENLLCLSQVGINRWCDQIRPDMADSIWCRSEPPMEFRLQSDVQAEDAAGPSDRDEPELTARFASTPLGPGRVTCFYHPDPTKTDRQGRGCDIRFDLVERVEVELSVSREMILSGDAALAATIAMIPEYWAALAKGE
jgi:membrane protein implicated in regulation of membrane protease activity